MIEAAPCITEENGILLFSMTDVQFIDVLNRKCQLDAPAVEKWEKEDLGETIHFGAETVRYIYKIFDGMQNSPSITLYKPVGTDKICEITVDYDDHAFSFETMESYKDIAASVLSQFFPSRNDEEINKLFDDMVVYSDEHTSETSFLDSTPGKTMYDENGIATYSYFAYGEYSHICLIPSTETKLP